MNFEHTEERRMLAETLDRFVAGQYGFEVREPLARSGQGWSPQLWRQFAELGAIGALFGEADGGYGGKLEEWVEKLAGWELEIVRRSDAVKGFAVLPKRWIVERTFAWLNRYRRLSKDYEWFAQTGENFIYLAMINLMLHRLAPESRSHNYLPQNQALAS